MRTVKFWIGLCVGAVAVPLAGLGVAAGGFINMSASGPTGPLDRIGALMFERNVRRLAPERKSPFGSDRQALAAGFEHYKSSCVQCHGAPDIAGAEWAEGMQPVPPTLGAESTAEMSGGELFHVIKHGVRMSGMPAFGGDHSDEDIWKIAAFVRTLDSLTDAQKDALRQQNGGEHSHGGHKATTAAEEGDHGNDRH